MLVEELGGNATPIGLNMGNAIRILYKKTFLKTPSCMEGGQQFNIVEKNWYLRYPEIKSGRYSVLIFVVLDKWIGNL